MLIAVLAQSFAIVNCSFENEDRLILWGLLFTFIKFRESHRV